MATLFNADFAGWRPGANVPLPPSADRIANPCTLTRAVHAEQFDLVERIRADERYRVARELHDSTAQLLCALQLQMSYLRGLLEMPAYGSVFHEIDETIAELHREVRLVSFLSDI